MCDTLVRSLGIRQLPTEHSRPRSTSPARRDQRPTPVACRTGFVETIPDAPISSLQKWLALWARGNPTHETRAGEIT